MSNAPVIDPEAIANLRALCTEDDSFLREVVDIFLSDTPERLAELKVSFSAQDAPGFIRAAHTMKGSASNLGAARMRAQAEHLELTAKKAGLTGLEPEISTLEHEFAEARIELQKMLA